MEDVALRVQTLPCRGGDLRTDLFQFGFLLLRANSAGFSVKDVVLLYALFNAAFVIAAPLVGKLGDRIGRTRIVVLSYLIYPVMSLGFAFALAKWQDPPPIRYLRRSSTRSTKRRARRSSRMSSRNGARRLWRVHPSIVFIVAAFLSLVAITAIVWLRPAGNST